MNPKSVKSVAVFYLKVMNNSAFMILPDGVLIFYCTHLPGYQNQAVHRFQGLTITYLIRQFDQFLVG